MTKEEFDTMKASGKPFIYDCMADSPIPINDKKYFNVYNSSSPFTAISFIKKNGNIRISLNSPDGNKVIIKDHEARLKAMPELADIVNDVIKAFKEIGGVKLDKNSLCR